MAVDNIKNFAIADVPLGYTALVTTIVVGTGQGANFPTPPFNATWYDKANFGDPSRDPNKEIVRVTDITGDTLTIIRAQEGTSATAKNTSGGEYEIFQGLTEKMIQDLISTLQNYADTAVTNLVSAAPGTLDTLNELAAALGDDPNFATTMTNSLALKADETWVSTNFNNYSHPNDGGGSKANLSGATIISGITVNSAGHVTALTTRLLTPADIGAADAHAHPYRADTWNPDWTDVQSKPSTATRWPTFAEVTGKPSTFAPSAHMLDSHSNVTITEIAAGEILKWTGTAWINQTLAEAGIAGAHSHPYRADDWVPGWTEVTGKPTKFNPEAHTHPWSEVTGKPASYTPSAHTHPWSELTSVPTKFNPSAHNHNYNIGNGTTLEVTVGTHENLHLVASTGINITYNDKTNTITFASTNAPTASKLQTARTISLTGDVSGSVNFDGSSNVSITATVADDSHNHIMDNIDGLATALSEKSNNHTHPYLPNSYVPAWLDITGKPATYPATAHGHAIVDISGLQKALDGKEDSHGHPYRADTWVPAWGDITGKPSTYAPSAHTLDSHSNIAITAIATGEILKWSGTAWINQTLTEAGIAAVHSHPYRPDTWVPSWSDVTGKPSTFTPEAHYHDSRYVRSDTSNTSNSMNGGYLVFSYGDSTNVDHIRYDEATNAYHFVADAAKGVAGNAALHAGSLTLTGTITASGYNKSNWDTAHTHSQNATLHRVINDAGTTATELWSASKIIAQLATKAPTHSHPYRADTWNPAFANIGSKPTTVAGYGITDAYTKTEVDTQISNVISAAPGALDTLNELAAALGDDPNFATTMTNSLATKLGVHYDAIAPTGTTRANYDGYFYATRVYNAYYNDIADFFEGNVDGEIEPGRVYIKCTDGKARKSSYYNQPGPIGIASDTYGYGLGEQTGKLPIAVAGFTLAYVDQAYPPGTPLTATQGGQLTKMRDRDKRDYPERIIATYYQPGGKGKYYDVEIRNRHWVKVK